MRGLTAGGRSALASLTLFLQEDTALCDDNGDVAVDIALTVLVEERDCDIGIGDALDEGNAKDAGEGLIFVVVLLRGALAKLPPPRGQIPLRRGGLGSGQRGGLGLPIAHARSLGIGVRACGHGKRGGEGFRAMAALQSKKKRSNGRAVVDRRRCCGVGSCSRHRWTPSGQARRQLSGGPLRDVGFW